MGARIFLQRLCGTLLACTLPLVAQAQATAAPEATAQDPSRWVVELKAGLFKPELDDYSQFYGNSSNFLLAVSGAWRFRPWIEVGAEIGYTSDEGNGTLANAGTEGSRVKYTLVPLQLYLNLRYARRPDQLFVPYIGGGVVAAWYEQDISGQSSRTGYSDIGGAGRAGLQLSLDRLSPRRTFYTSGDRRLHNYLFLEAQYLSTKKDGNDLGGTSYLLGLRMEF